MREPTAGLCEVAGAACLNPTGEPVTRARCALCSRLCCDDDRTGRRGELWACTLCEPEGAAVVRFTARGVDMLGRLPHVRTVAGALQRIRNTREGYGGTRRVILGPDALQALAVAGRAYARAHLAHRPGGQAQADRDAMAAAVAACERALREVFLVGAPL